MPRGPRLDSPGTLHHIIIRGINRESIVRDDTDRAAFVDRMGNLAASTSTPIYAWALLDNHAHMLLKSGPLGLPVYMRKLLSWYAQYYNRRHNRSGHVFQNRYKSIICEEEPYFQKLVAYIHLNPVRAGQVHTLEELNAHPWSGHAVIMGVKQQQGQDCRSVLEHFGDDVAVARSSYMDYLGEEAGKGRQPGLVGGGLVRSQGGWSEVQSLRKQGKAALGDERILGGTDFVKAVIDEAEETVRRQVADVAGIERAQMDIKLLCAEAKVSTGQFHSGSRMKPLPEMRKQLATRFVQEYGLSLAETARQLGVTTSAVYQILRKQRKT